MEDNKKIAVELFNSVWGLLDKVDRTEEEDYLMVHMAHASLYHWMQIGTPENIYIGEWQISRVYSVLKNYESSLFHGKRAYEICDKNNLKGFDMAYAYEALARSYSIKGENEERDKYVKLAEQEASLIEVKENKEMLLADLKSIV